MDYIDTIIKVGAALGAVGAIIGGVVKFIKFISKTASTIETLNDTIDELKTHSHENYMALLRLTIMSNEMPIGERISAGTKYLENGGNGDIKKFLKSEFNITESISHASHYKK